MWSFLLIQMMPNLYYPYRCNTTPLLCRNMAMPHWCPCLGGWTVLPNLACSRRADNGKQNKIRELFFLMYYQSMQSGWVQLSMTYDTRWEEVKFLQFSLACKKQPLPNLQWSHFVLHMQKLHHVNQEEKEHVLSCKCSVQ